MKSMARYTFLNPEASASFNMAECLYKVRSISGNTSENISAESPFVFLIRITGTVPSEITVPGTLGDSDEAAVGNGNSTKAAEVVPCTCSRHASRTRRSR